MTRRHPLSTLPIDGKCTATSKTTGDRCRQPAIQGGAVCRFHGGSSPQVKAAAAARIEEVRDLVVERILEQVQSRNDDLELATLVAAVEKLTKVVRLERGEATQRSDSRHIEFNTARLHIDGTLDRLGESQEARTAVIESVIEDGD